MARDLAREHGRVMVAEARHRRLVKEARLARRDRRRAEREESGSWWRRRRRGPARARPPLHPAPAPRPEEVGTALAVRLEALAERIAERGTGTERAALEAVHDAVRWAAPGVAAALVDQDGSETMRLRAFGVAHGVVLGVLGHEDQLWLLERLQGRSSEHDDRAA